MLKKVIQSAGFDCNSHKRKLTQSDFFGWLADPSIVISRAPTMTFLSASARVWTYYFADKTRSVLKPMEEAS